jgi:hypothetical protein
MAAARFRSGLIGPAREFCRIGHAPPAWPGQRFDRSTQKNPVRNKAAVQKASQGLIGGQTEAIWGASWASFALHNI